jgi:hypothetical protein
MAMPARGQPANGGHSLRAGGADGDSDAGGDAMRLFHVCLDALRDLGALPQ